MPALEGRADLVRSFAHPRIDDLLGINPGGAGPEQLAAGNDVRAAAKAREKTEDGDVGAGLGGKAGNMGDVGKGAVKGGKMAGQGGGAVQIERGAHRLCHRWHGNILAIQGVILVLKIMHMVRYPEKRCNKRELLPHLIGGFHGGRAFVGWPGLVKGGDRVIPEASSLRRLCVQKRKACPANLADAFRGRVLG